MVINACSQNSKVRLSKKVKESNPYQNWTSLANGIEFIEMEAPRKSMLGDSRLSILKLNPDVLDFYLYNATNQNNRKLTAPQWADSFDLDIVMNAGMYDLANGLIHRGFMKSGKHFNNKKFQEDYNSMIAFTPIDSNLNNFEIFDLACENWKNVKSNYRCYAQGMRMIDCNGEMMGWNKKSQTCSMLVAAKDAKNNIWFIFTRSPYSHNQMIAFMRSFSEDLRNAIYLEGGPETSMFININNHCIKKIGSYVSDTYANYDNTEFWPLPNVIGIKSR